VLLVAVGLLLVTDRLAMIALYLSKKFPILQSIG
jgi:hypothetical protein